jgi:hypothetical protein
VVRALRPSYERQEQAAHVVVSESLHVSETRSLLMARGLRAFVDGYMAVLLPAYLLALGFGAWEVSVLSTATLLGSAAMTLAVGAWGHRFAHQRLLPDAALLMAATGVAQGMQKGEWGIGNRE